MTNAAQSRCWMTHVCALYQYIKLHVSTKIDNMTNFTTPQGSTLSDLYKTAQERDTILFTPNVE